jgi:hypothetical protein
MGAILILVGFPVAHHHSRAYLIYAYGIEAYQIEQWSQFVRS